MGRIAVLHGLVQGIVRSLFTWPRTIDLVYNNSILIIGLIPSKASVLESCLRLGRGFNESI